MILFKVMVEVFVIWKNVQKYRLDILLYKSKQYKSLLMNIFDSSDDYV